MSKKVTKSDKKSSKNRQKVVKKSSKWGHFWKKCPIRTWPKMGGPKWQKWSKKSPKTVSSGGFLQGGSKKWKKSEILPYYITHGFWTLPKPPGDPLPDPGVRVRGPGAGLGGPGEGPGDRFWGVQRRFFDKSWRFFVPDDDFLWHFLIFFKIFYLRG